MTRFHVFLAFIAIMLLRVVVGFHFFKEGTDKLATGSFTAEYFLKAAKGPWSPMFLGMLDDPDGRVRFCYDESEHDLDPTLTFALWDDFLDRVSQHYQLGDTSIQNRLNEQRRKLAEQIKIARANRDNSVDTRALERRRSDLEQEILMIRGQADLAESILNSHQDELRGWLAGNRTELLAYFGTHDRVDGFDRDGESRKEVAVFVDSLRGQVDTIKADREKQMRQWAEAVESMWDSYESQIMAILTDEQLNQPATLKLHRPFAQENSKLRWINRIIPWFDTIVGALLILGLFTRLASAAGAVFLASVIATQPPWIPGTQPTYLYAVELLALLVIFATLAGRMGGLDFFLASKRKAQETAENSA